MNLKKTYRVIGVMSGTSLDGVDLCEVEFLYHQKNWTYKIKKTQTIPYNSEWKNKLQNAHKLSKKDIGILDEKYCKLLSQYILDFIDDFTKIDMVCSHGHTIWHQPEKRFTYQIGNLELLGQLIKKTVVCDFRTADVALCGQGAPLVPIGDKLLFSDYDYCINIGGFVNISYENDGKRLAFDICPANKVLNVYAEKEGFEYDDKGQIAAQGQCHQQLLKNLNDIDFYSESPPKSLGVEWLEQKMMPILNSFELSNQDFLNTLCHHIAYQISKSLNIKNTKTLITGGGAYHDYLIECIKYYSPNTEIHIPSSEIINYKEALIFGLLGVLKFRNEINVLKSVTGACRDHSSGVIFEFYI
ncbi:anhydro-N-acetylmuramic acid kinase [Flavobacterium sp. CS20]|jgi:anhydro-N-acetylmuramic acid kinase|uniref:anhydro-N-acetylmuramic acid kinase n=1 Tax=Flavobacterium sp. CS20 TaxID=2775246 RepID=UPI001B39FA8E|nr:anhydro-N-acetylmuramic acid kinase [Flavobacterium sp. CS20]QTY26940.1 anhydro-N-acetylmuramic acid kinase [Flavobacterium sp. CS20]